MHMWGRGHGLDQLVQREDPRFVGSRKLLPGYPHLDSSMSTLVPIKGLIEALQT